MTTLSAEKNSASAHYRAMTDADDACAAHLTWRKFSGWRYHAAGLSARARATAGGQGEMGRRQRDRCRPSFIAVQRMRNPGKLE